MKLVLKLQISGSFKKLCSRVQSVSKTWNYNVHAAPIQKADLNIFTLYIPAAVKGKHHPHPLQL